MKKIFILFLLFCIIPSKNVFSQEEAKKHPILTDKFRFEIGLFMPSKTVKIGADGSNPEGNIDFGNSFKFNDSEITPLFSFNWRFAKKWNLSAEYFNVINAQKAELQEDIVWDDITFKKGSFVRAGFEFNLYRIFIGRSFSQGLKHEFGAGLGVHAFNNNAFIEGEIAINEEETSFERRNVKALIPLPNIGIWYYYTPSPKWALIAKVDWFSITIDKYSGGLWNISTGIKYQIFRNVGIGIDYRYFDINARVNNSNWEGNFDMSFQGPLFLIHANF